MKKFVALLMAMIMALSLCSFASAEEELYAIRFLCINDYDSETKTADWLKYDVSKQFAARMAELGITFDLECVDRAAFPNIVTTRMAAGVDLPDVVSAAFCGIPDTDIVAWGMNGLIIPASDLVEKYDTDGSIYAYFDSRAPGLRGSQIAPDGKWYWFNYLYAPTTIDKVTGTSTPTQINTYKSLSIRRDWVEKIGGDVEKLFYTPDELFETLKAFQDQDVNGNGQKDESLGFSPDGFNNGIAYGFGLNNSTLCHYYLVDDVEHKANEVFSNWYDKDLVAYLEFMQKLYSNGLIDTSILSSQGLTSTVLVENKAALMQGYPGWVDWEPQIPDEKAVYMPIFVDVDGDPTTGYYITADTLGALYNQYFVTKACGNEQKVFDLFDFIYTDEYMYFNQGGVEGVAYTKDENGVITPHTDVLPEGATAEEKEAFNIAHYTLFRTSMGLYVLPAMVTSTSYGYIYSVNPLENDPLLKMKNERIAFVRANYDDYCIYMRDGGTYALASAEETDTLAELEETLNTFARESLLALVMGEKTIDELPAIVAQLEELGLKDVLAVYQARRDRVVNAGK